MLTRLPATLAVVATVALCACKDSTAPAVASSSSTLAAKLYITTQPAGSFTMGSCRSLQLHDSLTDSVLGGVEADSVQWTTTDTTIATVDANGLLSGWVPGYDSLKATAWRSGTAVSAVNTFSVGNTFDPLPWHPCIVTFAVAPPRTISMQVQQELDLRAPFHRNAPVPDIVDTIAVVSPTM
jgi:hypothetical protein